MNGLHLIFLFNNNLIIFKLECLFVKCDPAIIKGLSDLESDKISNSSVNVYHTY